ncbi:laminin subunit alpha-1 [Microtus ochrogaster]|uniref:Laminin subunit alpha-1 n=1 Tax=Microtus ochrogaster TaxID=79684 RepID=A0ABM1UTH5_MICOH|nr:laminin subunit alpha-1 [Microtus ochrogaster]
MRGGGTGAALPALLASVLWVTVQSQQRGLFPAILNLATSAHISANATCGEKGPEMFCKLVEHVPGRPVRHSQCRVCDGNSTNPRERHPISHAIDGTNNWWQSPSIQNGREYHWVTITLDLRQIFQVAYVIIKAANAPRPGNWILERSVDGIKFKPWQYYAISDAECLTRYKISPRRGPPTYRADNEVICTSYYSKLVPLEHGEIHTSLINGRPSADDPSPKLLEFTSARYIRLRLQRIRTLNADLMTLSHRDLRDLDPIVTRRYYYSIKDISVGGMCICYGHASSCPWDEEAKQLQCQCEHNTCGESCDRCCPGFHQQPWRPGTISSGNECEECNCHNKAKDCYYDENVAKEKRSLNMAGQYIGGGVCINCRQNTTGINCETCVDQYYRPHKVSPYEDQPCRPCDCDPVGSLSAVCIKDDLHSDLANGKWPGQCPCKEGYAGDKCDRCQFGYRGFPNCTPCDCSTVGSVNDDPCSEPCLCKKNVEGKNCDRCKPGFYNLLERNPQGCSECFCFGVSDVCDSLTWSISQVTNMSGWLVTDFISPNMIQSQQDALGGRHQVSINNTAVMQRLQSTYYWAAPEAYLGNKLTAFGGFLKYTVSYDIPVETVDGDLMSHADVIIKGNGLTLSTKAEGLSLQPYEEYFNMVRLVPENFRDFKSRREIDRDQLMTVLANVTHLLIRANYNSVKMALYRLDSVSLDVANPNAIDLAVAADVEHCECPQGYTGTSCESCLPGYYRVDGILFGGICQPCECHGHASECDIHGICSACTHNTTGNHCEQCLPGFYGTPLHGTPGDCQPCACPLLIDSNNFSPTCHLTDGENVVCDQCAPGYSGSWCERCADGYYGNPTVPGGTCVPCNCSGNVDPLEAGHCDSVTGECLKCLWNTDGAHCERCADGFYGDAVTAKNCRACNCHENGSLSGVCHLETGLCDCKPQVTGQQCDQCLPGFYGLDTGRGCMPCNCSVEGSTSDNCTEDGQCPCVPGVSGKTCNRCSHGFYGYQDGGCTRKLSSSLCSLYKHLVLGPHLLENVLGLQCSECRAGTFALQTDNPLGCSPCFCFGLSQLCSELEGYVRAPIMLAPDQLLLHVVSQSNLKGTVEGVHFQDPDTLLDAEAVRQHVHGEPFYWRLPKQFEGDQLLAYGGKLRYSVAFYSTHGSGTSNYEPQVLIKGGRARKHVIYMDAPAPENGVRQAYDVGMKEEFWKYFNSVSEEHVTHSDFMSVLSNIEYILIKASYGQGLQQSRIANISMEVGRKAGELPPGGAIASLLEHCVCPPGTTGFSCQDCAPGYHRGKLPESGGWGPRPLLAPCVPCNCNNHSDVCDPETGQCLNCRDHTAGDHCEMCAPGFYGKVIGLPGDCTPCTCPHRPPFRAAKELLSRIQKRFQKPQEKLKALKEAASGLLSNHSEEVQAAEELLREAETKTQESNRLLLLVKANLKEFSEKKLNVQEEQNLTSKLVAKGREWVDAATAHVDTVQDTFTQLERHRDELLLWTSKLRSHVDELVMQMSKRRARDLVHRAESHASELQSLAGVFDSDLENVRNVSLNATSAAHVHANIQIMMEEAERLAADAHKTANKTALISEPLVSQGNAVLQSTSRFLKESVSARRKQQGITLKLDELKNLTSQFQESVDNITRLTNNSLSMLREIPGGLREKGRKARELAAAANQSAARTLEEVLGLSLGVVNTSGDLSRVNATVQETNDLLHSSSMTTLLAGRKMKDMEMQANLLFDRLKPMKSLEENLSRNLSEIKLLISRARKQAASIKVAVSADRDCIRAYQPQISSANYNTLMLTVKTQEPDNLLFYLGSSTSSDFLAVEMRRGKVAFLWDLGSGSTRLEFPDVSINDNRWHSIYITRFGNVGSLSVKELSSAENPPVKTSKSPGMAKVLDINNSTRIFVGGLGGQIKKSPAVKVTHFKGCMGEAFLNGKSIGLWNYIEREGKCNGCFGSSQNEDSSFHFDGSGYAVVEKTLRTTVTQILVLFSTFSPNGLLFYLASNGTKDFLSIELVRGRVKVMVDLGSGPLTLMTDRRYNNGTWYKIAFQRNRKQGLLAVFHAYDTSDKETKQGETPGASSDLNRLEKDLIYVGGVPHSTAVRKGVSSRSYVGCIKNLEISRSTFDLLRNSYGVRKGCALEPIQSVSFLRGGYVEVPPKSLSPESSLLATFTTKNSSGIIVAALGKDVEKAGWSQAHVPFFSIMLNEGRIEVHVNSGDGTSLRKALLHAPTGSYGDGQEHSISLVRNRRVITIQMDESSPVEMKLGPLAEGRTIDIANLYVGGLPMDKGTPMLRMRTSFHGCIKNLVFDSELLDFTHAVGSELVELDTCLLAEEPLQELHEEHGELPPEPPTLQQPELCAVDPAPGFVPGAHQFGLSENSHLVLPLNQSDVRKRLQVQLNIRTFASSGLIYYMANQNQMDYATLQLHEGRLHFMFDLGKGRTKVSHPTLLSDGKWHTVKTEYVKRKGFLTVDGQESPTVTVVGNATTLDVEGKLYLGGLPVHYRARNIGNTTHSIPACIGEVTVNSKQLDKDSPTSAFAVDRCYALAQEGTFFEGSGYAALVKEGYRVRLDLNITLEFRTSSKNGVLLGISSAKVDAIGLEIVDGKVLFHVNNGAGRITATYKPRASRTLCDGKWHTLQAQKSKHRIALTVDGNPVRAESPHTHSTSADTNDPIYVGGYPAHVKQNCLTSQTSFRGCVRNLKLSRGTQVQALDLSRAFDIQGVFPHSCPGLES